MKMSHNKKHTRGFTLIELLVVIAIIGILAGIILPNLSTPRIKSRDAKRISDISQIKLSLELYADQNSGKYPTALSTLVTGNYLPALPKDPKTNVDYFYVARGANTSSPCYSYHLGAALEDTSAGGLKEDADSNPASFSLCSGASGTDFHGLASSCSGSTANETAQDGTSGKTEKCYDVINN